MTGRQIVAAAAAPVAVTTFLYLNTSISRYIEWSTHEPRQGEYHFTGNSDLEAFIGTAQRLGLDVILRIGPYICSERDMVRLQGGMERFLMGREIRVHLAAVGFFKDICKGKSSKRVHRG